jgi:hypothetical protein
MREEMRRRRQKKRNGDRDEKRETERDRGTEKERKREIENSIFLKNLSVRQPFLQIIICTHSETFQTSEHHVERRTLRAFTIAVCKMSLSDAS